METRMKIPPDVEWILAQLNQNGYEAFAVGGCVRDTILARQPEDWDVTTSARPEQVKRLFPRTVDTGIIHGTVTVIRGGKGYEVTTYRIDGLYEDGRHPNSVSYTGDLKEDLCRRDFTINAMAYSHETGIVDAFGGMEDIKAGKIRCVGDARQRFSEDALRLLRAIRFSAQLGFEIEGETYHAIQAIAPNLALVSRERIQVELTKLLLSNHPQQMMLVLESGISPHISPSFHQACLLADQASRQDLLAIGKLEQKKALRWAGFLRFGEEAQAVQILKELKMDNDTIRKVQTLLHWLEFPIPLKKPAIRRVMKEMPDQLFDDLLKLRMIHSPGQSADLDQVTELAAQIRSDKDCIRLKDLAVCGNDLLAAGIPRGKAVGQTLDQLFQLVLEHPQMNQKDILLAHIHSQPYHSPS